MLMERLILILLIYTCSKRISWFCAQVLSENRKMVKIRQKERKVFMQESTSYYQFKYKEIF